MTNNYKCKLGSSISANKACTLAGHLQLNSAWILAAQWEVPWHSFPNRLIPQWQSLGRGNLFSSFPLSIKCNLFNTEATAAARMPSPASSVTQKFSTETEEVRPHGTISHVRKLQTKSGWSGRIWERYFTKRGFILRHVDAICGAASHRHQVGEALCAAPLGAVHVTVLHQSASRIARQLRGYQLSVTNCSEDTKIAENYGNTNH